MDIKDVNLTEGEIPGPLWVISKDNILGYIDKLFILQLTTNIGKHFSPVFTTKEKAMKFGAAIGQVTTTIPALSIYELKYLPAGGLAFIDMDPGDFIESYGGDLGFYDN